MTRRPKYRNYAKLTIEFQEKVGLKPDGLIGRETDEAMRQLLKGYDGNDLFGYLSDYEHIAVERAPSIIRPADKVLLETPRWLKYALTLDGIEEIKGSKHNPKIIELFELAYLPFDTDETAWCSAMVCACLEAVKIRSTRNGMAKSFLNFGVKLRRPKRGAIAVFDRGAPGGPWGHTAFITANDYVYKNDIPFIPVFGGNQGDKACHKDYPARKLCKNKRTGDLIGIRWPDGERVPD